MAVLADDGLAEGEDDVLARPGHDLNGVLIEGEGEICLHSHELRHGRVAVKRITMRPRKDLEVLCSQAECLTTDGIEIW